LLCARAFRSQTGEPVGDAYRNRTAASSLAIRVLLHHGLSETPDLLFSQNKMALLVVRRVQIVVQLILRQFHDAEGESIWEELSITEFPEKNE
jgi:hypothetical protein